MLGSTFTFPIFFYDVLFSYPVTNFEPLSKDVSLKLKVSGTLVPRFEAVRSG